MDHLNKHKILTDHQHGYRNGCSTETQILKVIDLFAKGLENNTQIDSISLDFSRAFDTVPFQRLLLKMNYYGIRKLLPWFEDFLTMRTQRVIVEGEKSRLVRILSGIPQGTVIAGLLFLIFINDLPDSVTQSFAGLFCDDTLIAKEITCESDSVALQSDLNEIYNWAQEWGMEFNTVKCVVMTVSNKRNLINNNYYLNNMYPVQCLSKKEFIKYLGVIIDNKLTFKKHIEEKCNNSTKVLNMLRRNLHFAPKSVKCKAYMACVRPILEYASSCWSPTSDKLNHSVEMVQHNAAKFVTNTYPRKNHYKEFSISRLIKQLQWDSLEHRRNQSKLTMAYKILNNKLIIPPSSLPRVTSNRLTRSCNEANVGRQNQLFEPQSRLITTGKTFFYCAPKLWNQLVTPSQANAPSVEAFKHHFTKK
jgi:hypothetical protein